MRTKFKTTIGIAVLSVFTGTTMANAAILSSELKTSGTLDVTALGVLSPEGDPLTTLEFDNFGGNPNAGTGQFTINEGNGPLFTTFNPPPFLGGTIRDLPLNPEDPLNTFAPVDDFLAFAFDGNTGVGTPTHFFDLQEIFPPLSQDTIDGVTTSFSVRGLFETPDGVFEGVGTYSADISYDAIPGVSNFAEYTDFVSVPGNTIEGVAYSADFIVEQEVVNGVVPEASNLLGLLAIGLGGATILARKKQSH